MRPYYSHAGITIHLGDCRELLPIPADALICDPPYGISYKPGSGDGKCGRGTLSGGVPPAKTLREKDIVRGDDGPFDPKHLLGYPKIVLFGANHYADKLPAMASWAVWDKRLHNSLTNDFSDCELIWTNQGGPARVFRHLWCGLLKDSEQGEQRQHPTQKPIAIMEWVIARYCAEADVVIDPYMGSGTTLIAAKKLGHAAIGIEIEEKYCEISARRLEQEVFNWPAQVEPKKDALSIGSDTGKIIFPTK